MSKIINTLIAVIKNTQLPDHKKIQLGRWGAISNKIILNLRIDRSNEDHCGPCGQYAIEKQKELEKKELEKKELEKKELKKPLEKNPNKYL